MQIFPDNTVIILVSSFYHGFSAMKDAVVGGLFVAVWQSVLGVMHGSFAALVTLPGLLYVAWRVKTWVPHLSLGSYFRAIA